MSERITNGTFEGPLYVPPLHWSSTSTCGPGVWGVFVFDEDLGDGENSCVLSNYGFDCQVKLCQDVDFTNVDELSFVGWFDSYQRFGPPNGYIRIYAGASLIYEHVVDDATWRPYQIDVTLITGIQTLCFTCGPYADVMLHHVSAIGADLPPPPVCAFAGDPLAGEAPLSVQFIDFSTGDPTEWLWDFGDGYLSDLPYPLHEYALPGTYDVSLKVTNAGGFDILEKPGYVVVATPTPTFYPIWSIPIGPE